MQRFPITTPGLAKLQEELNHLKSKERIRISQAIAEARAHGDLKENAEYHAAREQQGFLEARIRDLENMLANAQAIDVTKIDNKGKVIFGVTIELVNLDDSQKVTYQIVGDYEADLENAKISVNSPIARALIGRNLGDVVVVGTPKGEVEYEIITITHI